MKQAAVLYFNNEAFSYTLLSIC